MFLEAGFYHSHPDHPVQWSPTDFAEAHWLGCSYVITEAAQGKGCGYEFVSSDGHIRRGQAVRAGDHRSRPVVEFTGNSLYIPHCAH
jgi:proteasome lid subunit RPN8/RPN11